MKKLLQQILNRNGFKIIHVSKQERYNENLVKVNYKVKTKYATELLVNSLSFLNKLNLHKIEFEILEENVDHLIVRVDNLKLKIESPEDIFIISEIFLYQDYNFISHKEYVFFDIGANIGLASLYLAKKKNIKHIYSFEPVKHTYSIALENFSRNEAKNVTIENFGLGGHTRNEKFIFNKNIKGNSGIRKDSSISIRNLTQKDKEIVDVEIKNISEEFWKIKNSVDNVRIGMKIDCEGGEYEIIDRLYSDEILEHIDAFIIEWHDHGAQRILKILQEYEFQTFSRVLGLNSGIIYALK